LAHQTSIPAFSGAGALLNGVDQLRRSLGAALDLAGYGPAPQPHDIVLTSPGLSLFRYRGPRRGPAVLLVPAPIKRPYIWDLIQPVSVVRRFLDAGFDTFLLAWTERRPSDRSGLSECVGELVATAVDEVARVTRAETVVLAGHSLGGTIAALFASISAARVRALLLIEAPIRFGPSAGAFAPVTAMSPDAGWVASILGNAAPGCLLDAVALAAAPESYLLFPWIDRLRSLGDPAALAVNLRVARWSLDEFRMPGRLFEDVVEKLYRADLFCRGGLQIGERTASVRGLQGIPLFTVFDPLCRVIPPQSALAAHEAVGGTRSRLYPRSPEAGVGIQHVGALVGRKSHQTLWPELIRSLVEIG
jgi:polyhydroxyalkanoate synthase